MDRSCFKPLVSIAAVESSESTNVHLVAVTSSGVRLYFTALGYRSLLEATPSTRPQTLTLAHVRLPPGYAANAAPQRPNQVHSALYSRGVLLLSAATASENDVVWSLSNSLFPAVSQLSESQNTIALDGKTWALSEVTPQPPAAAVSPAPEPPLVVTQHRSPARQFVLLTPQCCHMVTQLRPVDLLRQLLVDASGPDGAGVRAFFQLLREDQACATALILACSTSVQDGQLADWASRAIYLHGGQVRISGTTAAAGPAIVMSPASPFSHPQYLNMTSPTAATPGGAQHHLHTSYHSTTFTSPAGGSAGFNPNAISTPQMQQQLGQQQQFTPGSLQQQQQQQQQFDSGDNTFQFSGRHNGLYIYFGRILRPIWHSPLAREVSMAQSGGSPLLLDSIIPAEDLTIILTQLNALKAFVHANIHSQPQQQHHQQMGDKGRLQDAQLQERKSLLALKQLLDHVVQVLALWKVVTVDHQLHLLGQQPSFPSDLRMSLKTILIRDLLLQSGASVCAALIDALIRRYLDDAASTDQISEKLRHVCPSLYRDEDALCAKVNEQLMRCASDPSIQQQPQSRQQLLRQTLDACKQIPGRLNLASVCQQLAANQFYSGVVELCCVAADKLDPHRRAIHYYNNAANGEGDSAGPAAVDAFLARKNCYQQICSVLQQLYAAAACPHPQSASMVPKSPGSSTTAAAASSDDGLNPLEAQRVADETLHLALQCQDELCHVVLFDWLTDCKWEAKLLELQSPYLEAYLKRQTDSSDTQAASLAGGSPDQLVARYDLLWKYYEKTGNCMAAARVLSKLADAHSALIALPRRIEYLSRSIVCARAAETSSLGSCSSAALQGQFLYELEEKMDVARIQSLVLDAVQRLLQQPASGRSRAKTDELTNAVSRLNADLLDVTQLYEQFADPLGNDF